MGKCFSQQRSEQAIEIPRSNRSSINKRDLLKDIPGVMDHFEEKKF